MTPVAGGLDRVGLALLVLAAGMVVAYTVGALRGGWWAPRVQPRPKARVYPLNRHERWRGRDETDGGDDA